MKRESSFLIYLLNQSKSKEKTEKEISKKPFAFMLGYPKHCHCCGDFRLLLTC